MSVAEIQVGDRVRLLGLPDWLAHDLPQGEQQELRAFVGQTTVVDDIDAYGYFWLGFGGTVDLEDHARYSGHSFCVTREFLERAID